MMSSAPFGVGGEEYYCEERAEVNKGGRYDSMRQVVRGD